MQEYKQQLAHGAIQQAYRGLMDYMLALKTHFKNKYPEYFVSGGLYYGFMDMTYFSVTPAALKERALKIAVVFVHETFTFEVWLSGSNRLIQAEYWQKIKESGWSKYRLVSDPEREDAILQQVLITGPDFSDLKALSARIEQGTLAFTRDVEVFLSHLEN
jgi:hypothetical protein